MRGLRAGRFIIRIAESLLSITYGRSVKVYAVCDPEYRRMVDDVLGFPDRQPRDRQRELSRARHGHAGGQGERK
jgi:hypothetical protein